MHLKLICIFNRSGRASGVGTDGQLNGDGGVFGGARDEHEAVDERLGGGQFAPCRIATFASCANGSRIGTGPRP